MKETYFRKCVKKQAARRLAAIGIAASLLFIGTAGNVLAAPDTTGKKSKESTIHKTGHIPSAIDQSHYNLKGRGARRSRSAGILPPKYRLDEQGLSTVVKNQDPWGSCWAFGALSSVEGNVLKQQGASGSSAAAAPDYSERHLAWFAYQPEEIEGGQKEGKQVAEGTGIFDLGGNRELSTGTLAAWSGVETEASVPYEPGSAGDWSVEEGKRYDSAGHLLNADFLPGTAEFVSESDYSGYHFNADAAAVVKQALMDNGVVDVSYYADQSMPDVPGDGRYITEDNKSQFTYQHEYPNHEVSIIGWDDTYDRTKFTAGAPEHLPEGDGAWIIKNSWNNDWGDNGYFYLSYYDRSICDFTSYQMDLPESGTYRFDHNYQYDYLGMKSMFGYDPAAASVSVANVFTAKGSEVLKAVSAVTVNPGSTVAIKIYRLDENEAPVSAEPKNLLYEKNVTVPYGGYHTIDLDKDIALMQGERFSVVETIQGSGGWYLPIERGGEDSPRGITDIVAVNPGESYIGDGSGWADMTSQDVKQKFQDDLVGNVMIKAFTKDTNDTKPLLTSLTLQFADAEGVMIGSDQTVIVNPDVGQIEIKNASSYTSTLKIKGVSTGVSGTSISIMAGGKEYQNDEDIPRNALTGENPLTIKLTSPGGYYTNDYTVNFVFETTILEDGRGNELTDAHGYLPQNTSYATQEITNGQEYEALAGKLNDLGGRDQFRLYDVSTTKGSNPFNLKEGQTAVLKFAVPDGYDPATTRLYEMDMSGGAPVLTDVTGPGTASAGSVESVPVEKINGYYVLAVVKDLPELPSMSPVVYSPAQRLADIGFPVSDQGTWAWDEPGQIPEVKTTSYAATFTPAQDSSYASYTAQVPLTVTPAEPELNVSGAAVTYGQTLKDSALSGTASCGGVPLNGGSFKWTDETQLPVVNNQGYEVSYTPAPEDTNYMEVTGTATIQVSQKPVTVDASPAERQYGDKNPEFVFVVPEGALAGSDSENDLGVTLSCPADAASPAGTYEITGTAASDNYDVSVTPSELTVAKRPAKLIPKDVTINYKDKIPKTFDYTVEGLVNQDQPSVIKADLSAGADEKSPAGTYEIGGTASADNYDVTVHPGHLTINPVVLSAENDSITNQSSLPSGLAGKIAVAGSFDTTKESRIVLTDVPANSAGYKAMAKAALKLDGLIMVCDIRLEKVDQINGKMTVTLAPGDKYNGKKVTVYHYVSAGEKDKNGKEVSKNTLDIYPNLTVKDGTVSVEVYSLSPFGVALEKNGQESGNQEVLPGSTAKNTLPIGAKTGDRAPLTAILMVMAAAFLIIVICVILIRKRHKH